MNLLTDDWIPVQLGGEFEYISLKRLLCEDKDWQLSCNRDDMELATLQLAVCLTQIVFLPEDEDALLEAWERPLNESDYEQSIEKYLNWFDLLHPETPFMQIKGTKVKETTPIQKLFVGLPEGNNHSFFNLVGEVHSMGLAEVAVALFNQNANAPGFSGKQKAGLRGAKPINTLIMGGSLRKTIWLNVLTKKYSDLLYPQIEDKPVWVEPIVELSDLDAYIKQTKPKKNAEQRKTIYSNQIGLVRGLFWLPVLIELCPVLCDGQKEWKVDSFKMGSDFYFEVEGVWPHPHSPRKWALEKDDDHNRTEYFLSFATTAPAWTQLSSFLIKKEGEREGHTPAPVITQYQTLFRGRPLNLIVGGYQNKQALILQRRHELFSLKQGWGNGLNYLKQLINMGLECKKIIGKKLYRIGKHVGVKGLASSGEKHFFNKSEYVIHSSLSQMEWKIAGKQIELCKRQLINLSKNIFNEVVLPYEHDPKLIEVIVKSRAGLHKLLNSI